MPRRNNRFLDDVVFCFWFCLIIGGIIKFIIHVLEPFIGINPPPMP